MARATRERNDIDEPNWLYACAKLPSLKSPLMSAESPARPIHDIQAVTRRADGCGYIGVVARLDAAGHS